MEDKMKRGCRQPARILCNQAFISKAYLKYLVYEKHKTLFLNLRDMTKSLKWNPSSPKHYLSCWCRRTGCAERIALSVPCPRVRNSTRCLCYLDFLQAASCKLFPVNQAKVHKRCLKVRGHRRALHTKMDGCVGVGQDGWSRRGR